MKADIIIIIIILIIIIIIILLLLIIINIAKPKTKVIDSPSDKTDRITSHTALSCRTPATKTSEVRRLGCGSGCTGTLPNSTLTTLSLNDSSPE
jgi:hypothetical protein